MTTPTSRTVRQPIIFVGLALCLALATLMPWAIDAATPAPDADFVAPMSKREARAIVREAQLTRPAFADNAALPESRTVFFEQTGHHLSNRAGFLDFWRANGQVQVFGFPISEELVENGRVVQYFERARFEYHADLVGTPFQVQLGLLGVEAAQRNGIYEMFQSVPDPQSGARYIADTGHVIFEDFYRFWEKRGGLAVFGFPISEAYEENGRLVQWFERQRLEYHPEEMGSYYRQAESWNNLNLAAPFEVQLTSLGREAAAAAGARTESVERLSGVPSWSPDLWPRAIYVDLTNQWLTAYEGDLAVFSAPVATGKDGFNTPAGEFAIYAKLPMQTMTGNAGGETWNVPNIPSVMYINGGVALHGTYWHNAFGSGRRMSHGCVNLGMDDAAWIYEWSTIGVPVTVHY
jgi:hypothetical protein